MHTLCPGLTAPTNGALSSPGPYAFPNQVTVTCNSGYQLNGVSSLNCQADGTWSNTVGTCTARTCPALTAPANGALNPPGPAYSYPSTVIVTCNSGYQLTGATTVTCQTDGTWSAPVGTCAARACPLLTAPTNGALSPTGQVSYPNSVTFTCNTGYVRNGAASATCQADGTWNNNVPTCTPRTCPVLTAPTNGVLSPTGQVSYPNGVTFTCNTGHVLNGAASATCQADGTWSESVPTCTRRQCPVLTAPTNGIRTPSTGSNLYQDQITFTCNAGYVLSGDSLLTCRADGTWSSTVPTCSSKMSFDEYLSGDFYQEVFYVPTLWSREA
ncbi:E-selectin-like [Branchiostoma floridae x Branchiostoma japonicum]